MTSAATVSTLALHIQCEVGVRALSGSALQGSVGAYLSGFTCGQSQYCGWQLQAR